jgi:class 3 adenylate cyclase
MFCDLRGFTAFSETSEPEDIMQLLAEYHGALGPLIRQYEGTLDRFTGDGLMAFFNDPLPCADAPERAVKMAVAMRNRVAALADEWRRAGHDLAFAVGVAQGHATLGRIGYEGRFDYTAIGNVTNLAARMCAEAAGGQILISQRVYAATEDVVTAQPLADIDLRGFSRPTRVYNVLGLDAARTSA